MCRGFIPVYCSMTMHETCKEINHMYKRNFGFLFKPLGKYLFVIL
jgi:hypothetical protein